MNNKYPDKTPVMNRRDMPKSGNYAYIGRGSKWGNPFKIGDPIPDGEYNQKINRATAIILYLHHFMANTELHQELHTLNNSDGVACYCSPKACHGEVLTAFVDAYRKFEGAPFLYANCDVLADGRTIPLGGFDSSIPQIRNFPRVMLVPYFYDFPDNLNARDWEFKIGDHTTGYFSHIGGTVYDAIRGGLELYFEAKVAQGKLLAPAKDEEFVTIEWFLEALTAHGLSICEYDMGKYKPVAKDITEWVVLPYEVD